ncbi:MAG: TonB C-terminal domain-containing protein [Candidatus Omnitrophica bacterium]|jgi:outer membrane biosynthesis protein TonB|nr:TonB C-terminal domain-containing protein [Candidatus Omnitrophota bacterium]MDD5079251.1 TonB C-terminal domain-containing protein [Candidatus Omnitrophota bacterium]
MNTESIFQRTLIASLILHSVIFLSIPQLNPFIRDKRMTKVRIVYLKNPPQPPKPKPFTKQTQSKRNSRVSINSRISKFDRIIPRPAADKNGIPGKKTLTINDMNFIKPAANKPDINALKKKISLAPVEMNKINNPSYVSYYNLVREKIRRAAYQNYSHAETGEVYLAFVVSKLGALNTVKLIEERSSGNIYLREVAIRSIRDAAPFPPFSKDLDYPQLSFNVIISFTIE